jgi:hypothetical protein
MTNINLTLQSIGYVLSVVMCVTFVVGCPSRKYLDKTEMAWGLSANETAMAKRDLGIYANTLKMQTTDEVISSIETEQPKVGDIVGPVLTSCRNYLRERELASRGTNAIPELNRHITNVMNTIYVGPSAPAGSIGDMCRHRIKEALSSPRSLSNSTNMYLWTVISAETAPLLDGYISD